MTKIVALCLLFAQMLVAQNKHQFRAANTLRGALRQSRNSFSAKKQPKTHKICLVFTSTTVLAAIDSSTTHNK
jgi:hypothetical protein